MVYTGGAPSSSSENRAGHAGTTDLDTTRYWIPAAAHSGLSKKKKKKSSGYTKKAPICPEKVFSACIFGGRRQPDIPAGRFFRVKKAPKTAHPELKKSSLPSSPVGNSCWNPISVRKTSGSYCARFQPLSVS